MEASATSSMKASASYTDEVQQRHNTSLKDRHLSDAMMSGDQIGVTVCRK